MTSSELEAKEGARLLRQALADAGALAPSYGRESTEQEIEVVCFTIHDQLYALPTTQVSAVLNVPSLTELPHSPAHLCGILSHQGRIVAVVDVALLDGREPVSGAKRILIIDGAGLDAGIRVSQVIEIAQLGAASIEPVSASLSPPEHVVGQFRRGDGVCFVMDAGRLLERVRKRVLARGVTR
jgi:purine-binding chemotaxis protein CheW